jgi:hypothetical protein
MLDRSQRPSRRSLRISIGVPALPATGNSTPGRCPAVVCGASPATTLLLAPHTSNNPVNGSDPSGHCTKASYSNNVITDDECEEKPLHEEGGGGEPQADVSEWLVGEMDIERSWLERNVDCNWNQVCLYRTHFKLFGDYGKYDIKRIMLDYIGPAVILCGGATCKWVDYSTPGNIMYGYLSASRGVPQSVSWLAAGILEYRNALRYDEPYTGTWNAWGDNPGDKSAVDFGYALYQEYSDNINLEDFQISLTEAILNTFQLPSVIPYKPAYRAPGSGYPVDFFLWPSR